MPTVLAVGLWLLSFFHYSFWVKTLFQIENSLSAIVHQLSQLCWHNNLRINLSTLFTAVCMITIEFKLTDTKLENSEAHLRKLGKNVLQHFKVINVFCKNGVLNTCICWYLQRFYTYKKIDKILLKFYYFSLRWPKIIEIGLIFPAEKAIQIKVLPTCL